jgi:hypothetical protein
MRVSIRDVESLATKLENRARTEVDTERCNEARYTAAVIRGMLRSFHISDQLTLAADAADTRLA